jgi:hypothetical protein
MNKILLSLFLLCVKTALSQNSPASVESSVARLNQINRGSGLIPVFNLQTSEIKGSPFFYKDYADGEVWLTNN